MTQPTKWSAPLGSGADVQELPDDDLRYASFSKIFPQITQVPLSAGGIAPRRIDFNSIFKLLADNIYYYQNGGVFEYSDTADYEKGALVRYNDNIYLCIQDNSTLNLHNPDDMNYWLRVVLNNELADYLPLVGGNVTGNLTVQNKNVVRTINDVEADANGNIDIIVPDIESTLQPKITGLITLNGTTDNTVSMTGIVPELALEVGDVIRIDTGSYNKLHTVESITDNNSIIVNYEHAGNRGNGSLKLPNFTGQATVTRVAKWSNAPIGWGQGWVNMIGSRSANITYTNTSDRSIMIFLQRWGLIYSANLTIGALTVIYGGADHVTGQAGTISMVIPSSVTYSSNDFTTWWELR